ncbi:MAG: tripartite tricarboxylate transporter substrate binding protein [Betaproteobacteria bacterium]|nr:tripartite tricarboxylate transporter substrate binding protein [Betaproteobacteria bacterium]
MNPLNVSIAFVGMLASVGTLAQTYPAKPLRMIVPTAPSGAYDTVARGLAIPMSVALGQPIVIDNRAAAGGIVGMEAIARAPADGYTVGITGVSQLTMHPSMYAKLPYDTRRDFTPIGMVVNLVSALWINSSLPTGNLQDFIAYAKANPNKVNYGSAGIGHSFHLGSELLSERTGISMTHIPYKGTAPALQDLIGGRIQLMFYPPTGPIISQIKAGKLRALAMVGDTRYKLLPDVPTFTEQGIKDMLVGGWAGLSGPAGLPRDIVARLNKEVAQAMALPETVALYDKMGFVLATSTPEQLAQKIDFETTMWGSLIKRLDIKGE